MFFKDERLLDLVRLMARDVVFLGLLVIAMSFAGCLSAESASPGSLEDQAEDEATWETLVFSRSGAPGEWALFYHELPEPVDQIEYGFELETSAGGGDQDEVGLFVSRPALVSSSGDELRHRLFHPFETRGPLFTDRDGGTVSYDREENWRSSIGGGLWTGFFFFVASNAPWEVHLEIHLEDQEGPTVGPGFLSTGDDAVLVPHGDQTLSPLDEGPVAGSIDLDADLSPGWTHLQYEHDAVQPDGVRSYEAVFQDGFSYQGTGRQTGYYLPMLGGSASSTNWRDYMGHLSTQGDTFSSSVSYAQAHTRMEAALIHLPLGQEDLPDGLTLSYAGSSWPFQNPLPVITWEEEAVGAVIHAERLSG